MRYRSRQSATALSIVLALSVLGLPQVAAPAEGATPMKWEYITTSHTAVWNDGSDSMTIKIKTSGPVNKVIIDDNWGGGEGLHAGDQVGRIRLYDDGTHGDSKAGDKTFTRSGVSVRAPWDFARCIWVELFSGTGAVKKSDWSAFQITALDRKHQVALTKLDDGMRISGRVANLKVKPDVYQLKADPWERKSPALKTVVKRFYKRYPDRYDFITVWSQQDAFRSVGHRVVRNSVRGIGRARFDRTGQWGSKGRLQSVNYLGRSYSDGLIEETFRQWVPYLDETGLSAWGRWRDINVRGYHGGLGFKWVTDRKYRITWVPWDRARDHRASWLELYLAGLAQVKEVPQTKRLKGLDQSRIEIGNIVTAKSVVKKSIGQITKKYGYRKPNFGSSKKDFRMGTILVTVNRFATPAEMAMYHLTMAQLSGTEAGSWSHPTNFEPSWSWATRGRSTMDTQLGPPK